MMKKIPYVVGVLLLLCVAAYFALQKSGNNDTLNDGKTYVVTVKPGMTTADIANMLYKEKIINSPQGFRIESKFSGLDGTLKAGTYALKSGTSNAEILDILHKGKVQTFSFTVPEGYSIEKIAIKLEEEKLGNAEKFKELARTYAPYEYMQTKNPYVIYKAEGFVYPSTYILDVGMTEEAILKVMVDEFDRVIKREKLDEKAKAAKMSVRDLTAMASLVELEAVYKEEQPRIAGVFLRRVKIGMPIQSDTTVQYLLGIKQKEIITYDDLKIKNPYNTYIYYGLPPGPIASPGLSALNAVVEPEKTEFLYFVAEKDGHHRFSKTYAEHLRAIREIKNQ